MAIPVWQPTNLYPTGSIVRSTADLTGGAFNDVNNGGFETGSLAEWGYQSIGGTVVAQVANTNARTGLYAFYWPGGPGTGNEGGTECYATSEDIQPVSAGLLVTAKGWFRYNTIGDIDGSQARMYLQWFNAAMAPLGDPTPGTLIKGRGNNNKWVQSTVSGTPPAGAEFVAAAFWVTGRGGKGHVYVDDISWDYTTPDPPEGLVFKAVQPTVGTSGATEPTWPTVNGLQVVDASVTWEALVASRITYRAIPILKSGATEPTPWPTVVGESIPDNTISWQAATRQAVEAPNSKVWAITASKVYAADGDIIEFSATVNPLDWTTPDDAGYLPSGLNQNGSNDTAVLNIYRSSLVSFSSTTFQNWQVDPDPANMSLLDVMEGIGSTWQHAAQPVGKDLFYLAALGVRTVGISAGSTNLVNGDVGMPIDPLVREATAVTTANQLDPLGMYYPSLGQYILCFPEYPPVAVSIHGDLEFAALNQPITGFAYTGKGGIKPYTFQLINGTSLPPGLTLQSSGQVTGSPTVAGSYSWDVEIEDSTGGTAWKTDTAQVVVGPSISGSAPDGEVGEPYSFPYTVTPGDYPIASTSLQSGSTNLAPIGLSWDDITVTVSGDPTTASPVTLIPRVVDTMGLFAQITDDFNISIGQGPKFGGFRWFTRSGTSFMKPSGDGIDFSTAPEVASTTVTSPKVEVGSGYVFIVGDAGSTGAYADRDLLSSWSVLPAIPSTQTGMSGEVKIIDGAMYAPLGGGASGSPPFYHLPGLARMGSLPAGSWVIQNNQPHSGSAGTPTTVMVDKIGSTYVRVCAYYNLIGTDGLTWADGSIHAFGAGVAYCADSSGTRMLIGGGSTTSPIMSYTINGTSETLCTLPGGLNAPIVQVKHVGGSTWLAMVGPGSSPSYGDKLLRSTDNGLTFTAVSLGTAIRFGSTSGGNVDVNTYSGRTVIVADSASGKVMFESDDKFSTWTQLTYTEGPPSIVRYLG